LILTAWSAFIGLLLVVQASVWDYGPLVLFCFVILGVAVVVFTSRPSLRHPGRACAEDERVFISPMSAVADACWGAAVSFPHTRRHRHDRPDEIYFDVRFSIRSFGESVDVRLLDVTERSIMVRVRSVCDEPRARVDFGKNRDNCARYLESVAQRLEWKRDDARPIVG
jgi:hypothetical protein